MGFMDKVKNFFYEDVEEDEEVVKTPKTKFKEKSREKIRENNQDIEIEDKKIDDNKVDDNISEMELFKSERTFNFPMDLGDDIFDEEIEEKPIKKKEEKTEYSREKKNLYSGGYSGISKAKLTAEVKEDNTPKKFRPTPVVSPVYGILDKNYTVDDVVDKNLSKTKEFSIEKKIVDYDTVRNKAYKELDEEIEKTLTSKKDIFFNLDEDEKDDTESKEDFDINSDVVITFDDEEIEDNKEVDDIKPEEDNITTEVIEENKEEEDDSDLEPDIEIPIIKKRAKKKETKEEKSEKEDLFNLIDNMYKDEEEDEE